MKIKTKILVFFNAAAVVMMIAIMIMTRLTQSTVIISVLSLIVVGVFAGISIVVANMVAKPAQQITRIAQAIARGNLDQEIPIHRDDEIGMLATAFREMTDYLKGLAAAVEALSRNDLSVKIKPKSESDVLSIGIIRTIETLQELASETKTLAAASQEGNLKIRGSSAKFNGVYRELIESINAALDAVIAPLNEAAAVLQQVAARNLSSRMHGDYKGESLAIKASLNQAATEISTALSLIDQHAGALANSSEQLKMVSHLLSSNAEETSLQTSVVSAAAEDVSKTMQTSMSGAEQMGANIREIAKNATEAAKVAAHAVKVVEETNTTVAKLGNSSAEIGNVVKAFTSIAAQANLLARNATIEAERAPHRVDSNNKKRDGAGEAGKGFAVVANDAQKLAKATEDIGKKIEMIQLDTGDAVVAVAQLSGVIKHVSDISSMIASAVEKQSVATNEITHNIAEAAYGSCEIAQNISAIAQAAKSTNAGANNTLNAADELRIMADALQKVIAQFNYKEPDGGFAGQGGKPETLPVQIVDDIKLLAARDTKSQETMPFLK